MLHLIPRPHRLYNVTVSSNNVNLRSAISNPTYPLNVVCVINNTIGSANTSNAAFRTGDSWAQGSYIVIKNNSTITGGTGTSTSGVNGVGGDGGRGGKLIAPTLAPLGGTAGSPGGNGSNGGTGGAAFLAETNTNTKIVVTNSGSITGGSGGPGGTAGSGGGGGGGGGSYYTTKSDPNYGGGGGGGGRGSPGGVGGVGGADSNAGSAGSSGSESAAGNGGAGGSSGTGGPGGAGGGLASSGSAGTNKNVPGGGGGGGGTNGSAGSSGTQGSAVLGNVNIIWNTLGTTSGARSDSTSLALSPTSIAVVGVQQKISGNSILIPSTAQVDDVAVLFEQLGTISGTPTLPTLSGWTTVDTRATTLIASGIYYKKLVSGDINSTLSLATGSLYQSHRLVILRGNNPFSTVTAGSINGQATTATPTSQTLSMSGVGTPLIGFASYGATNSITTRGATGPTFTELSTLSTAIYVKYTIFNSGDTPINATISQTDNGTNILQSFYLTFT
jgi:hypothetical protein